MAVNSDEAEDHPQKLPARVVFSYAAFAIPLAALGLPLVVYLPPFYASEVGISLTAVGAAFGIARLFDLAIDPVFGGIMDKTRVAFGRRRAWIAASIPILMVAVWFTFNPPQNATITYLYICLFVLYVGFTMASVSHLAWGAELSPHYHGRSQLQGWREACLVFGYLIVLAIPAVITGLNWGTQPDGVRAMGLYFVFAIVVFGVFTLWRVPDKDPPKAKPVAWNDALIALRENKPFQIVVVAELLSGFAPGVTGALFIFFFTSILELGQLSTVLLLIYFVAGLLGVPLWLQLSYRIGKHRALVWSMIYQSVAFAGIGLLPKGEFLPAVGGMLIAGIASNAGSFLLRAMMADVVDADRIRTGEQRTGLFFGLMLTSAKIGLALAPLLTYPVLEHFGYVAKLGAQNTDTAKDALFWMYLLVPIIGNLLLAALVWNFPIDARRQAALRAELEKAGV